ncbi:hypothetical protein E2C01_097145 [Portunus trituberculatus]|uniref:Uncharacterized protein n=1 Tax=Portunus trituberculatus TaxID=210409 RepID=A0A5B7JXJ9_PORTR|nr:hypothetical protein [Portunus trituberculatus]
MQRNVQDSARRDVGGRSTASSADSKDTLRWASFAEHGGTHYIPLVGQIEKQYSLTTVFKCSKSAEMISRVPESVQLI